MTNPIVLPGCVWFGQMGRVSTQTVDELADNGED